MESIMDYLEMLEEILENARTAPFSANKVMIDREKVYDLVGEMRMNIPSEIRQAQRIIEDHDRIIEDAKGKAESILKEANNRARDMADEHEIYKLAVEQAEELMDETKKGVRELRLNSMDYADEVLSRTESTVRAALANLTQQYRAIEDGFIDTINELYNNRQELRGGKGPDQQ